MTLNTLYIVADSMLFLYSLSILSLFFVVRFQPPPQGMVHFISVIDENGPAAVAMLRLGDRLIRVNDVNVMHASHAEVGVETAEPGSCAFSSLLSLLLFLANKCPHINFLTFWMVSTFHTSFLHFGVSFLCTT